MCIQWCVAVSLCLLYDTISLCRDDKYIVDRVDIGEEVLFFGHRGDRMDKYEHIRNVKQCWVIVVSVFYIHDYDMSIYIYNILRFYESALEKCAIESSQQQQFQIDLCIFKIVKVSISEELVHHLTYTRCDSFYNLPAYMGKTRASGIGKGSKMTFGAHNKVPAPNKYQMQSTFDQKNKGIKFSLGRQVKNTLTIES